MKKLENDFLKELNKQNISNIKPSDLNLCTKNKGPKIRLSFILSFAVVIIVVITCILINKAQSSSKYLIKYVNRGDINNSNDGYIIKHWDKKTNYEKWPSISYNNRNYELYSTILISETPTKYIGNKIGECVAVGYDIYEQKQHTCNALVYEIKDFKSELAIAVKYENDDCYYSMVNINYEFANTLDFINSLNISRYATFKSAHYYKDDLEIEYYDLKNNDIISKLFVDKDAPVEMIHSNFSLMSISFSIEAIGRINLSLSVSSDGYINTNILSYNRSIYIGKDKVNSFIKYIDDNYQGYKIVYVNDVSEETGSVMVSNGSKN